MRDIPINIGEVLELVTSNDVIPRSRAQEPRRPASYTVTTPLPLSLVGGTNHSGDDCSFTTSDDTMGVDVVVFNQSVALRYENPAYLTIITECGKSSTTITDIDIGNILAVQILGNGDIRTFTDVGRCEIKIGIISSDRY